MMQELQFTEGSVVYASLAKVAGEDLEGSEPTRIRAVIVEIRERLAVLGVPPEAVGREATATVEGTGTEVTFVSVPLAKT